MKLYLSGPMTGYEDCNYPLFNAETARLRALGHDVINPAENDQGDPSAGDWTYFLKQDIRSVTEVEAVAVLPGWEKSKGANLEVYVARALSLPILWAATLEPVSEEVRVVNTATGGAKGRKPERYALLPWPELAEVARLYARGADKYEARNWERGYDYDLSFDSLIRHATQWWNGESVDPETECSHLASVIFHALALMRFERVHPALDTRPAA
jgi:hypothetical protein